MCKEQRIAYIKYLSRLLEEELDNKGDCNIFYNNSYENLIYSEYKVKTYLHWWWTPPVVYIPFIYKDEEIFIVTKDLVVKKLI